MPRGRTQAIFKLLPWDHKFKPAISAGERPRRPRRTAESRVVFIGGAVASPCQSQIGIPHSHHMLCASRKTETITWKPTVPAP
jgi:hypothetical protein